MGRSAWGVLVLVLGAWLTLAGNPGLARADGMSFRLIGGDADVRATAQRAVLWQRGGTWELHLQPVFARGQGAAAWVVPFPVRPTVSAGNPDFLDQLEVATSPVFLRVCAEGGGSSCFGCMDAAGVGDGEVLDGSSFVRVWERGQVGGLDYAILSAQDGDDLVAWLDAEGFEVPAAAAELLADLELEGTFFFAARLGATLDPSLPLAPVRFELPGLDPPSYPLRLTAAAVPAGQSLDLTLWVIFPNNEGWVPDGREVRQPSRELADRAALDGALEELFAAAPDALVLLHSATLDETGALEGQVCEWMLPCVGYAEVGLEAPAAWAPEMEYLRSPPYLVDRYQARLGAGGLEADLRFRPLAENEYLGRVTRVYTRFTCRQEGSAGAWVALLAAGVALRLRRRA
ncbi:MAG TPA: DUF2330 domain-containing protein [Myxococcota bacterium]|nr:DUF2330 domain-containing protein [Myxococcota bacterium]HRY95873.1 DUF2330 domain-containing protein [Myxococcota bacterium]HSA22106.1 DUF2330 domain-containing protein [Myxococcota bacterium]